MKTWANMLGALSMPLICCWKPRKVLLAAMALATQPSLIFAVAPAGWCVPGTPYVDFPPSYTATQTKDETYFDGAGLDPTTYLEAELVRKVDSDYWTAIGGNNEVDFATSTNFKYFEGYLMRIVPYGGYVPGSTNINITTVNGSPLPTYNKFDFWKDQQDFDGCHPTRVIPVKTAVRYDDTFGDACVIDIDWTRERRHYVESTDYKHMCQRWIGVRRIPEVNNSDRAFLASYEDRQFFTLASITALRDYWNNYCTDHTNTSGMNTTGYNECKKLGPFAESINQDLTGIFYSPETWALVAQYVVKPNPTQSDPNATINLGFKGFLVNDSEIKDIISNVVWVRKAQGMKNVVYIQTKEKNPIGGSNELAGMYRLVSNKRNHLLTGESSPKSATKGIIKGAIVYEADLKVLSGNDPSISGSVSPELRNNSSYFENISSTHPEFLRVQDRTKDVCNKKNLNCFSNGICSGYECAYNPDWYLQQITQDVAAVGTFAVKARNTYLAHESLITEALSPVLDPVGGTTALNMISDLLTLSIEAGGTSDNWKIAACNAGFALGWDTLEAAMRYALHKTGTDALLASQFALESMITNVFAMRASRIIWDKIGPGMIRAIMAFTRVAAQPEGNTDKLVKVTGVIAAYAISQLSQKMWISAEHEKANNDPKNKKGLNFINAAGMIVGQVSKLYCYVLVKHPNETHEAKRWLEAFVAKYGVDPMKFSTSLSLSQYSLDQATADVEEILTYTTDAEWEPMAAGIDPLASNATPEDIYEAQMNFQLLKLMKKDPRSPTKGRVAGMTDTCFDKIIAEANFLDASWSNPPAESVYCPKMIAAIRKVVGDHEIENRQWRDSLSSSYDYPTWMNDFHPYTHMELMSFNLGKQGNCSVRDPSITPFDFLETWYDNSSRFATYGNLLRLMGCESTTYKGLTVDLDDIALIVANN